MNGLPAHVDHVFRLDIDSEPPTRARLSVRVTAEQAADDEIPSELVNFEVSAWVELGGIGEAITMLCEKHQSTPATKARPGIREAPEEKPLPADAAMRLRRSAG